LAKLNLELVNFPVKNHLCSHNKNSFVLVNNKIDREDEKELEVTNAQALYLKIYVL